MKKWTKFESVMIWLSDTYLQAFYFSLEPENVVFHVAAVETILPLFFRSGWAFCTRFLIMNG